MKNFIGLLALTLLLATNSSAKNSSSTMFKKESKTTENTLGKRHFEGSITLSGGCVIKYSIDIDFQLMPPRVNSIHGSLTLTGSCEGTQTFKASAATNEKGTITAVETDLKDKNLQTKEFKEAFIKSLNELKIFEQK